MNTIKFEEKNKLFMKSIFEIEFNISRCSKTITANSKQSDDSNQRGRGRPRKSFENCSRQTQKRRSKELQNMYSQEELTNTIICPKNTQENLNKSKNKFSKDLINGTLYMALYMALYMDMGLTKEKYKYL